MFNSDYKWNHDYVRLLTDTGFSFERQKSDNFDKNKISSIDVDRIVEEKDFATIDKLIPCITKFVLDPDQARILDQSFVKTFLLSQLAIQYLVYCKKYLDNTVALAKGEIKKLKEDNAELNLFVDDLKTHISTLMKQIDEKSAVTCTHCHKVFSSEDFLNSHIKRRHSAPLLEAETDKLQMEIKDLKGRLNSAEKLIQKEQSDIDAPKESDVKKIDDLQQKFDELRLQVQSELRVLQAQQTFQEKYETLLEKMTLQGASKAQRRESTTQTELGTKFEEKDKENIPEANGAQKQMTEFGEALETKVTSSLQKIESQMESFWMKLNEMERYRKDDTEKLKPMAKPRVKPSIKSIDLHSEEVSIDTESHVQTGGKELAALEALILKKVDTDKAPKLKNTEYQTPSETTMATKASPPEDIVSYPDETTISEAPSKPGARKRPHSASRKSTSEPHTFNEEILKDFSCEVEKIVMRRLQDLGVSPEWRGLPTRSFQRAMEIVSHQATLMKKMYPKFDTISVQMEDILAKKLELALKQKTSKAKHVESKPKRAPPKIELRNRHMYDTDSDSEIKPLQVKENLPYSAVIEELKAVTSKIDSSDNEVKGPAVKTDDHTKGVLKSYPSAGSLTKKKVLFNLDTIDKEAFKDGGSTTSAASSVFDATPRKDHKKDVEDLSDFDFSDM